MSTWDCWQRLHEHRLSWVETVRTQFLRSLQTDEVKALFASPQREAKVVVFGKTAAGKTTLILKLLGVDERCDGESCRLVELGRILRGNEDRHKTGTASAVIYRRGGPRDFTYCEGVGPEQQSDAAGVLQRLQDLRSRVERGQPPSSIVRIGIPEPYFDPTIKVDALTIVDIPGTGAPEGGAEDQHLGYLISSIVRAANLILVVSRADAISEAVKTDIPGLGHWSHFRDRVRFVFSYSISPRSVREAFWEAGQRATSEWLRQYFAGEVGSAPEGACLADRPAMAYPLEYGESWQRCSQGQPDLHREFDPVVQKLVADLRDDIRQSSTETSTITTFLRQEHTVGRLLDEEQRAFEDERSILRGRRKACEERAAMRDAETKERSDEVTSRQQAVSDAARRAERLPSAASALPKVPDYDGAYSASALDSWIVEYLDDIRCRMGRWLQDEAGSQGVSADAGLVDEARTAARRVDWQGFAARYRLDRYFPRISSQWSEDLDEAKAICGKIRGSAIRAAGKCLCLIVEGQMRTLSGALDEAKAAEGEALRRVSDARASLKMITNEQTASEAGFLEWRHKTEEDHANCKRFRELLSDGWAREVSRLYEYVNSSESAPAEKALCLAVVYLVDGEIRKLVMEM